jgi:4-aminobutyrate aminotransferase-like enzyme/Ser/Thr protein kinase RdoA (MazF antagonist)
METPGVMHAEPPRLSPGQAEEVLRAVYGLSGTLSPLVSERDQNFAVQASDGTRHVLKVSNPAEDAGVVEMEALAVEHVAAVAPRLPVPRARHTLGGALVGTAVVGGVHHLVRLLPLLPGRNPHPRELDLRAMRRIGVVTGELSHALRGFFHPAAGRVIEWDQKQLPDLLPHADLVVDPERRALLDRVLERVRTRLLPALPGLRAQVIHNDLTLDNLLMDEGGGIAGIIDFGDMVHTPVVLDVPATLQSLVRDRSDIFDVAAAFLAGYTSIVPLERDECDLLGDLLLGRMAQTILISVWRTRRYPENAYITEWQEPAWELLHQLDAEGFEPAGRRLATLAAAPGASHGSGALPAEATLLERRRRVLGSALAPLTYRRPLYLVGGHGAWMVDARGDTFLDAYNNVPVVGHAHPRVADAIGRQAATLNTNTRYLHPAVVELAERISASLPEPLDTVMFVNSGSEANDLAWRLARAATGEGGALVTQWAYHGVTTAIDDMSPSEWRHGRQPVNVETIPAPDTYRPSYANPVNLAAARQAVGAAVERLSSRGVRPAAIYLDSMLTSDGIFAPDAQAVAAILEAARAAGALVVADEVQAGHGRSGEGLWTFPAWGVIPDVVTFGKPMGNGHPIAAVATRAALADRLAAETEFFSTFGGNPVACVAGLAVLDVIEDEGLIGNAAATGGWLRDQLRELAGRQPSIGDVRGRGLMIGVELVDAEGRADTARAERVRDEMRARGVLIGTTRREGNVLKIRPPLCLTRQEAGIIVATLDEALGAMGG